MTRLQHRLVATALAMVAAGNTSCTTEAKEAGKAGYQIVFQSDRDGGMEVYAMDADGSGQTNLTRNAANAYNDRHPTGSPDGSRIAFRSDRAGNPDVWVMTCRQVARACFPVSSLDLTLIF